MNFQFFKKLVSPLHTCVFLCLAGFGADDAPAFLVQVTGVTLAGEVLTGAPQRLGLTITTPAGDSVELS